MIKEAKTNSHTSLLPRSHAPKFLMCPPDFYGIEYEINPWMNLKHGADRGAAKRQWHQLFTTLTETLGACVELVAPVAHQPDMVFTANAGLVFGRRVILSHFRYPERQGETEPFRRWFEAHDYQIETLDHPFEGEGDALFCGERLFLGYQFRTDAHAHKQISEILGIKVISLQLTDPRFYHLDTCFCPLRPDLAAYYRPAFEPSAQQALQAAFPHLLEINEPNALHFAANAIVENDQVVMNQGCPQFQHRLEEEGFRVYPIALSQFLRAGGSAKCLVLRLNGSCGNRLAH